MFNNEPSNSTPLNDNAVHVNQVSKQYLSGTVYIDILKNVNLLAKKGEITMITGPSGSGKTTLLCIIAGTLKSDKGNINVFGTDINTLTDEERTEFRKKHIGFIFQQFHLLKTLNVIENVYIPLLLLGYNKHEALKRASEMIANVGLKKKERVRISLLSGGEQQRVAIARALVHDPFLIICDEPTAALDAENGTRVMQLFAEKVRSPDRAAIIVTHDNRIFKYADSIVKIEDGAIISQEKAIKNTSIHT